MCLSRLYGHMVPFHPYGWSLCNVGMSLLSVGAMGALIVGGSICEWVEVASMLRSCKRWVHTRRNRVLSTRASWVVVAPDNRRVFSWCRLSVFAAVGRMTLSASRINGWLTDAQEQVAHLVVHVFVSLRCHCRSPAFGVSCPCDQLCVPDAVVCVASLDSKDCRAYALFANGVRRLLLPIGEANQILHLVLALGCGDSGWCLCIMRTPAEPTPRALPPLLCAGCTR